jgi:hypothetical protein
VVLEELGELGDGAGTASNKIISDSA